MAESQWLVFAVFAWYQLQSNIHFCVYILVLIVVRWTPLFSTCSSSDIPLRHMSYNHNELGVDYFPLAMRLQA